MSQFFQEVEPPVLADAVRRHDERDETAIVLVAESDAPSIEAIQAELAATGASFFGGVLPGLIADSRRRDRGALVLGSGCSSPPLVFDGLGSAETVEVSEAAAEGLIACNSGFLLVDGHAQAIGAWLRKVYDHVGHSLPMFGGGAGSLDHPGRACLFTEQGVFANAAIVVPLGCTVGVGVRHGWRAISDPLVVDRVSGNRIESLDWSNPLEVYSRLVEADGAPPVTSEGFAEVAQSYPFGVQRVGHEVIVRDPIAVTEEGHLVCVGEVPEHGVVTLLKGSPQALIDAAAQATTIALEALEALGGPPETVVVVDCISRSNYLGPRYSEELASVEGALREKQFGGSFHGLLSLGEVASTTDGPLEFLNKTTVVGALRGA